MDRIMRILVLAFLTSVMGSYYSIGTNFFVLMRYITPILMVLFSCIQPLKITISKNKAIILTLLIITFVVYPIILIITDVYKFATFYIIQNSIYYLLTFLATFFIGDYYNNNKNVNFFEDTSILIFLFLIIGAFSFRDISFNIPALLRNLLQDTRLDRSYIGFTNPNQVGIFAGIGLITSVFSPTKNVYKFSVIVFLIFILLNTGSRTPILSLLFALLAFIAIYSKELLGKNLSNFIFLSIIMIGIIVIVNINNNSSDTLFYTLNDLSTNRLSRQLSTIQYLISNKKILFGYGMFNTSFFNSQINYGQLHTDSYYTYILATMGIVGVIGNLFIIMTMYKIIKNIGRKSIVSIFAYCVIYGFFEATLFFPTSFLTIVLLSLFFYNHKANDYTDKNDLNVS